MKKEVTPEMKLRYLQLSEIVMKRIEPETPDVYCGNLSAHQVEQLIDEEFMDVDNLLDNAPTAREFLQFAKKYSLTLGVYVSSYYGDFDIHVVSIKGNSDIDGFKDDWNRFIKNSDIHVTTDTVHYAEWSNQ